MIKFLTLNNSKRVKDRRSSLLRRNSNRSLIKLSDRVALNLLLG